MTTTPCVSPATGRLRPDERVHYAYGMVLGLDEFLQEQLYAVSKDHLHDRTLHGFGTVSGLAVTVGAAEGDADDRQVTISPGIGCDQWGREFAIDCAQCARVGAWIAAQATGHAADVPDAADSGSFPLYVVAAYDECLQRPVPIPGQPCATSEQAVAYSRTRDAWRVELRWAPPAMPRWDSDRRLARILSRVVVVEGLDHSSSDEAAVVAAVRALADRADDGPGSLDPVSGTAGLPRPTPGPLPTSVRPPVGDDFPLPRPLPIPPRTPTWRLPAAEAAAAIDRILTVWVTQVRPGLELPLGAGEDDSDPAVLLATLDVTLDVTGGVDLTHPRISACAARDDGRPYLLHTQLIQELRSFGANVKPPIQLATLTAASDLQGITTIDAWFHLPSPVKLPATVRVADEDGSVNDFATHALPAGAEFSYVWRLVSPAAGASSRDGLQVSVAFPATGVLVGDAATTLRRFESQGRTLVDQADNGDLVGYAEVRAAVPPGSVTVAAVPNSELVSIETVSIDDSRRILELWFHLQPRGVMDDTFAREPVFTVYDDTTGAALPVVLSGPAPWSRNVWRIAIKGGLEEGRQQYLRFVFATGEFIVESSAGKQPLADWIGQAGLTYVGQHPDGQAVVAFHHVGLPDGFHPRFPDLFDKETDLPPTTTPPIVVPPTLPPIRPGTITPPVITLPPVNPGPLTPGPIVATPVVTGPLLPPTVTSTVLTQPAPTGGVLSTAGPVTSTPAVTAAGGTVKKATTPTTPTAKVAATAASAKTASTPAAPTPKPIAKAAAPRKAPAKRAAPAKAAKAATKKTSTGKKTPGRKAGESQ